MLEKCYILEEEFLDIHTLQYCGKNGSKILKTTF